MFIITFSKTTKILQFLFAEEDSKDWVGLRSLTGANASGWKFQDSFYGNFNVGRRPAMDTAWGRRVYDQYEIEFEVDKPKHSYLQEGPQKNQKKDQIDRQRLRKNLGLWDVIFSRDIVPVVEAVRNWEADHEEKERQLKKLNLDMATIESEIVATGDEQDPVNKFRRLFCKTGSYLRPDDMRFCVTKTNFHGGPDHRMVSSVQNRLSGRKANCRSPPETLQASLPHRFVQLQTKV